MKKKPEDSPYLNARYNHNSRESAMFFSRLMWQIVGIVSMLTVLGCVAGIIYVAIQAKYIPFVIKVDKLGQPLAVSVALALTRRASGIWTIVCFCFSIWTFPACIASVLMCETRTPRLGMTSKVPRSKLF